MMNTLFVTRAIPIHPTAGGMERVAWDLARTAAESSNVTVLTTTIEGYPKSFTHEGISVITLRGTRPGRYSIMWWCRTALYRSARRATNVLSVSAAATAMVHIQRGPKYIFQAHGTALAEARGRLKGRSILGKLKGLRLCYWAVIDYLTYSRVDRVVAVSNRVSGALSKWPYNRLWNQTELKTVVNATDTEYFAYSPELRQMERHRLGLATSDVLISTVSRLDPQKGADRLIRSLVDAPVNFRATIAGSGPQANELEALVQSLGLSDRVTLAGPIDRRAVLATLCAADVFAFPVRDFDREGLSVTVLEALSVGVPVLAPERSVWPTDIAELMTYVDFDRPGQVQAAAAAVMRLGSSRASRLPVTYGLKGWVAAYFE